MHLRTRHISFLLPVLFALAGFFSCAREEVVEDWGQSGDGIVIALTLGERGGSPTKTLDAISQIDETFRGIEEPVLIPFARAGAVTVSDDPLGRCSELGTISSLNAVSNSKLYERFYVPNGTRSFLFYGTPANNGKVDGIADETIATKKRNGSLIVRGLDDRDPSGISFSPDPFVSDVSALESSQQAIIDVLNSLLSVSFEYYHKSSGNSNTWLPSTGAHTETITWDAGFGNTNLQNWFVQITNNGEVFSGAGVALEMILTDLYNKLSGWSYGTTSNMTLGGYTYCYYEKNNNARITQQKYYELFRDAVLAKIRAVATVTGSAGNYTVTLSDSDMRSFPSNFGLPDGAVAIKFNGTEYIIADSSTGDVVLVASQYCYPAKLWYFCNSRIKATRIYDYDYFNDNYYTNSSSWSTILAQYELDNAIVTSNVTGIVIKEPVQYGTALLEAYFQGSSSISDKGGGVTFTIGDNDTKFPLEGLIIAGQRKQGFDFSPIDVDDYYIYDTDFGGNYYLRTVASGPLRTSVLHSAPGEKVRIAIELRNNSGVTFEGLSGTILPGYKFYLMGELDIASASSNPAGLASVFESDHLTRVTLRINSLAKAYNTVPDLRDPQLQLGVTAQIDWILSTPEERILY